MNKDVTDKKKGSEFQQDWSHPVGLTFDQNSQPPKTRGEKIFNGLSWALFGWIANAAVSIKLADTLENRFRPAFIKGGNAIAESPVFKPFFKNKPEEGASLARSLFSVIALLPGGYIVLFPVKWMEDRKPEIVKTLDKWFGPKNPDENTEKLIEARHSYLDAAPKLSWGDMFKGRTLPVLGIVATHFAFASDKTNIVNIATGKDTFKGLNHYINKSGNFLYKSTKESRNQTIRNAADSLEKHLDKGITKHVSTLAVEDQKFYKMEKNGTEWTRNGNDRLRGYLSNISVDLLYSAIVAAATFVIGHLSAFKREENQEIKRNAQEGKAVPEKAKFHLENSPSLTPDSTVPTTVAASDRRYEERLAAPARALQQTA